MFDLLLHFVDLRHPLLLWRLAGAVHNKQKWLLFFFSLEMIRQASTAWESVNLFIYWLKPSPQSWNMLQACHSQSRVELTSCVCSLARESSPFMKRDLWKGYNTFYHAFPDLKNFVFFPLLHKSVGVFKGHVPSEFHQKFHQSASSILRGNWCSAEASIPSWSSLGQ